MNKPYIVMAILLLVALALGAAGCGQSESADQATPTPAPTDTSVEPSATPITRTHIYLVAVGDASQSGEKIGCDDSLIPVEVVIEPGSPPLEATLNELLTIKSREYGQSGLYNALHQSDLNLESVSVDDGQAKVRLSGTLTLGGVCDDPRVRAQLRQTALQYEGVNQVSIWIDGTPLDEVLRLRE